MIAWLRMIHWTVEKHWIFRAGATAVNSSQMFSNCQCLRSESIRAVVLNLWGATPSANPYLQNIFRLWFITITKKYSYEVEVKITFMVGVSTT